MIFFNYRLNNKKNVFKLLAYNFNFINLYALKNIFNFNQYWLTLKYNCRNLFSEKYDNLYYYRITTTKL